MIAPSNNAGDDQVFGLAAMWPHPCHGYLSTLMEAACCTHPCLRKDTLALWHVGTMTDCVCSTTCLQLTPPATGVEVAAIQWLGGVPRGTKWGALRLFNSISRSCHSGMLSLWIELTQDVPFIEVVLGSAEPETANTRQMHHPLPAMKPPHDIAAVLNQHLQGALEQLQWTPPATFTPTSQQSMPQHSTCLKGSLLSAALGVPPSSRAEDPLSLEGTGLAIPDLMATSSQTSPAKVTPQHIPSTIQVSHSPSPHPMSKTLDVAQYLSPVCQSQPPPGSNPTDLPNDVLWLQGEMNARP